MVMMMMMKMVTTTMKRRAALTLPHALARGNKLRTPHHYHSRLLSTAKPPAPVPINLVKAFQEIDEPWDPRVCADVGSKNALFQVKVVQLSGEFVWHHHEDEDEVFIVMDGEMRMKLRTGDEDLKAGELITIPRGVEHCPVALTDTCNVLLLEPASTLNTGSAAEELEGTVHDKSNKGDTLTKTKLKRINK